MTKGAAKRKPSGGSITPEAYRGGGLRLSAIPNAPGVQMGHSVDRGIERMFVGYRRCTEFDPLDQPGQDAAALVSDRDYVVGVVADGVSQSFFGNIAAGYVSEHLIDLIWSGRKQRLPADELERSLLTLQQSVQEYVIHHQLSPSISDMLRDALEATRKKGSQAVFSAFHLARATGEMRLYQVGDVDAWVTSGGETKPIRAEKAGRWSSAGGNKMQLCVTDLAGVRAVLLASDGVPPAWIQDHWLGRQGSPTEFEEMAEQEAHRDDVSMVAWQTAEAPVKISGLTALLRLRDVPTLDVPIAVEQPAKPPRRRRKAVAITAGLVAAGYAAGFGTAWYARRPALPPAAIVLQCKRVEPVRTLDGWVGEMLTRLAEVSSFGSLGPGTADDAILRVSHLDSALADIPLVVTFPNGAVITHRGGPLRIPMTGGQTKATIRLKATETESRYQLKARRCSCRARQSPTHGRFR